MGRARGFDVDEALDAALELFWQRSYDGTSIQALCRAMDLQPGSVYAAFGSKRDLFVVAVRRYIETVSAEAVDRINGVPSGLQGLHEYFDHLVDAMVEGKRARGCLVTNSLVEFAARDPELAGVFQLHLARLQTSFAAALGPGAGRGRTAPGSRTRVGRHAGGGRAGDERDGQEPPRPGRAAGRRRRGAGWAGRPATGSVRRLPRSAVHIAPRPATAARVRRVCR